MGEQNGNAPEPEFNMGRISRMWKRAWTETLAQVTELQMQMQQRKLPDSDDQEGQHSAMAFQVKALRGMAALSETQERLLAQVLVDIPREWLVDNAPDELDWSDPASLGWLQEERFGNLVQALTQVRRENSKN